MKVHNLKTHPGPFQALFEGSKRHEWRRDDRGFEVGDQLRLEEWSPKAHHLFPAGHYTGRALVAEVTHLTRGPDFGIPEGFVVMSVDLGVAIPPDGLPSVCIDCTERPDLQDPPCCYDLRKVYFEALTTNAAFRSALEETSEIVVEQLDELSTMRFGIEEIAAHIAPDADFTETALIAERARQTVEDCDVALGKLEALGMGRPWPILTILPKLIEATDKLFSKGYDGHGWEEIRHACESAKRIVLDFPAYAPELTRAERLQKMADEATCRPKGWRPTAPGEPLAEDPSE